MDITALFTPKLGWKAVYPDEVIRQYQFGKPETNFKEVLDKGLPSKFFLGDNYGVDLKSGEVLIDGNWLKVGDENGEPLKPVELIYFRRNTVSANAGKVVGRVVLHFVGYKDESGKRAMVMVTNDGVATFGMG